MQGIILGLAIGQGVLVLGLSAWVFGIYVSLRRRPHYALPIHIAAMSASYLILGAMAGASILAHPEETWRTGMAMLAFGIGDAGLIHLLYYMVLQDRHAQRD